jgi:hypothetical protein
MSLFKYHLPSILKVQQQIQTTISITVVGREGNGIEINISCDPYQQLQLGTGGKRIYIRNDESIYFYINYCDLFNYPNIAILHYVNIMGQIPNKTFIKNNFEYKQYVNNVSIAFDQALMSIDNDVNIYMNNLKLIEYNNVYFAQLDNYDQQRKIIGCRNLLFCINNKDELCGFIIPKIDHLDNIHFRVCSILFLLPNSLIYPSFSLSALNTLEAILTANYKALYQSTKQLSKIELIFAVFNFCPINTISCLLSPIVSTGLTKFFSILI